MQNLERDAIPSPALPRLAPPTTEFRHGSQHAIDRQRGQHGCRSAGMIAVAVRNHQGIDPVDPLRAQVGHHHTLSGIRVCTVKRPRIVDQRVFPGAHHAGHALANVQQCHPGLALGRLFCWPEKHRQQQEHAQKTPRHAPRKQTDEHAESRHNGGPSGRCRRLPDRPGGAEIQELHEPFENPMRQCRNRPPRDNRAEQGKRCDDKADHRDGQRVGQRRNQRELLKDEQQHRQGGQRRRPLHQPPGPQPLPPALAFGKPGRRHIEQGADRAEREPESGGQHRPGIKHQNHQQREQKNPAGRDNPPRIQGQPGNQQHVERALGGHGKPGQQGIKQGRQTGGKNTCLLRRQAQGQRRRPSPAKTDQPAEQRGHHGDVQSGNTHQMGGSGAIENTPQIAVDGLLVADGQRNQNTGQRIISGGQGTGVGSADGEA